MQHTQLQNGGWEKLTLAQQMANIGSEVFRTINWRKKNNEKYSQMALKRALELVDLSIDDVKNKDRVREIVRLKETLLDYFLDKNSYKSSDMLWEHYFLPFNYYARRIIF
jgi:hypothetical protein